MDQFQKTTALAEDTKEFPGVRDNGQGSSIKPISDIHCAFLRDARGFLICSAWKKSFMDVKLSGWLQSNWPGIDGTQVSSKNNTVSLVRLAACHKTIPDVSVMSSCYKTEHIKMNIEA
ncbi:hypothetical protein CDAR_27311 [Caerostris darwini]|uniref:Uncharacterized protein n=1 Tax=Caerostris darwini TaxID=1538125 RepID=A0AAV4R870_9ARAC|nr:hypothetical protein CDAR_27311 [Caerostris darwini]